MGLLDPGRVAGATSIQSPRKHWGRARSPNTEILHPARPLVKQVSCSYPVGVQNNVRIRTAGSRVRLNGKLLAPDPSSPRFTPCRPETQRLVVGVLGIVKSRNAASVVEPKPLELPVGTGRLNCRVQRSQSLTEVLPEDHPPCRSL